MMSAHLRYEIDIKKESEVKGRRLPSGISAALLKDEGN